MISFCRLRLSRIPSSTDWTAKPQAAFTYTVPFFPPCPYPVLDANQKTQRFRGVRDPGDFRRLGHRRLDVGRDGGARRDRRHPLQHRSRSEHDRHGPDLWDGTERGTGGQSHRGAARQSNPRHQMRHAVERYGRVRTVAAEGQRGERCHHLQKCETGQHRV